jgi:F0F1-type ATP synthase delta subunit
MAKLSRRRLAREVVRLLGEQPNNSGDIMKQLAGYIIANKLVNQVDLLMKDVADELYLQRGQLDATVDYVFELTASTKDALTDLLKQATGAQTVQLEVRPNPSLLGGVVLKTPRLELDLSARSQLKQISLGGTTS